MKDFDSHNHIFGSDNRCQICDAHAPEPPAFLRRQTTDYECAISMLAAQTVAKSKLLGENLVLKARIAELEARLATAEAEVVRLNQWADGMTDIALKERATGEAYQRELRDKIADLEAKVEKAPCSDFCRDAKEKHHIPYTEHHHACWKVEALGLEGQDYMRRTEAK